jgi:hypothetical protein
MVNGSARTIHVDATSVFDDRGDVLCCSNCRTIAIRRESIFRRAILKGMLVVDDFQTCQVDAWVVAVADRAWQWATAESPA